MQHFKLFLFGSCYICYTRLCCSVWLYYITVEYFHCMCVPRIHAISFIKRVHGHLLIGWLRAPQRYMPQRHTQWKLTMFSLTPPLIYTHVSARSLLTNTFNTLTHTCRRGGDNRQSACDRLDFQSCHFRPIAAVSSRVWEYQYLCLVFSSHYSGHQADLLCNESKKGVQEWRGSNARKEESESWGRRALRWSACPAETPTLSSVNVTV